MKLIILEGIPTAGKTVLGKKIQGLLNKKLDKKKFKIFHFNDDIRNKFDLDVLKIIKEQDKLKMNKKSINIHLKQIIETLKLIEKKTNKECIFIIDRFHFSYLSINCSISDFQNLEKSINKNTLYILLNFNNYRKSNIFNRLKSSLVARGKAHGFTKHFYRIISNKEKGKTEEERIFNHYQERVNKYNDSLKQSKLTNKLFIPIDTVIRPEEYDLVLKKITKDLFEFLSTKKHNPKRN